MAVRYAVATGNANNTATWNGGTLPASGDYIYANGYTVTFTSDENYGTGTISTEICPITGIGGGKFNYSNNRILTMNVVAGTTMCLQYINVISILLLIGNVTGGSGANAYGINYYSPITIIGNVTGGSATDAHGVYRTINGYGCNITGNITGGSGAYGVFVAANSTFTGNITAGIFPAIYAFTPMECTGIVTASAVANAILPQGNNYILNFSGQAINVNGWMAIVMGQIFFSPSSSTAWIFQDENLVNKPLYTADVLENPPAESDTRSGVVYGIGSNYTGKMVVPIEGHVIQGLEYDVNKIGQLPVAQTINSQDVTDIMSDIANIETKIDNVDNKIDTIDTSINTVNNNISNMNIDINTIENELDTAITNINTIDGKVDVIDGKIDTLPTDTLNELKQDDLGERLSKVGTIEEMTNIIINS